MQIAQLPTQTFISYKHGIIKSKIEYTRPQPKRQIQSQMQQMYPYFILSKIRKIFWYLRLVNVRRDIFLKNLRRWKVTKTINEKALMREISK